MALPIIGAIAGGAISALGASSAARQQSRSANRQMKLAERIYDEQSANFSPFLDSGTNALRALNFEMGLGEAPEGYGGFTASPGYQFRMDQGRKAIEASAAARGGLFSGATGQALNEFGQGLASQEYDTYFNRLAGLTSTGLAAAGNQAQAGNAFTQFGSNALANQGDARAAGIAGMASGVNTGINNALGVWAYQKGLQG